MRSFLGPALGALFFILFREFLSIWTPNWLLFFGLLFVGFIVFSPTGLVGVAERVLAPFRKREVEAAAMAGRAIAQDAPLPAALAAKPSDGPVLIARELAKSFGGIRGRARRDRGAGPHPACADRPERRRQDHRVQSGLRCSRPTRFHHGRRHPGRGLKPEDTCAPVSAARSRSPMFGGLTVEENVRLAVQARHAKRFAWWTSADGIAAINAETTAFMAYLGLKGMERAEAASLSYGGQRLLDMGLALATAPHILLLDEPLAGLAAGERTRVAALVKNISREIPVLLVEHDIDRVFQIADVVP
jgi:ABC-type cobalamin/Fe3+-siderophores transport system ATPase subunit